MHVAERKRVVGVELSVPEAVGVGKNNGAALIRSPGPRILRKRCTSARV
jgi:hypothetical protein